MGIGASFDDNAWNRHRTCRRHDRGETPPRLCRGRSGRSVLANYLIAFLLIVTPAWSDPLRVATYNTELTRKGPGLLYRDALRGHEQVRAVARVIAGTAPDVILLQGVDFDAKLKAAAALRDQINESGHFMSHVFAYAPNTGVPTGYDLDGDGRAHGPADAHGFGQFAGQGGMVLLSRYPVTDTRDFTPIIWTDLEWVDRHAVGHAWGVGGQGLRLASVGAWQVTIQGPDGPLVIDAFHATPPVFDGPEDRNGLRNRDQLLFWAHLVEGVEGAMVLMGDANNDPSKGEGRSEAINALLTHPRFQDPLAGQPTVDWSALGLGHMRVDYILPSQEVTIIDAGISPPDATASRHSLVWMDIRYPSQNPAPE